MTETFGARCGGCRTRPAEARHKIECVGEEKRAVRKEVVANDPIGYWGLRRNSLESRMSIDHTNSNVKAGIRDAPHPHTSIVVRHITDQPINRVVCVSALVDVPGAAFSRFMRSNIYESSF